MTQTYGDPDSRRIVAAISSAIYEGERVLFVSFDQKDVSAQIEWEDTAECPIPTAVIRIMTMMVFL